MKIRPKKSLGQNFLRDKNIIKEIVEVGNISKNNVVLEVGPGTGNLTEFILKKKPKKIYVIEKDSGLVNLLKNKFNQDVSIINEDILNVDLKKIIFSSQQKVKLIFYFVSFPYLAYPIFYQDLLLE